MSQWIKNGGHWCKVADPQPSFEEIQAKLNPQIPFHPRLRGLKATGCGAIVGGSAHTEPLDPQPLCQKSGCKS